MKPQTLIKRGMMVAFFALLIPAQADLNQTREQRANLELELARARLQASTANRQETAAILRADPDGIHDAGKDLRAAKKLIEKLERKLQLVQVKIDRYVAEAAQDNARNAARTGVQDVNRTAVGDAVRTANRDIASNTGRSTGQGSARTAVAIHPNPSTGKGMLFCVPAGGAP